VAPEDAIRQVASQNPADDLHAHGNAKHFKGIGQDECHISCGWLSLAFFVKRNKEKEETVNEYPEDNSKPVSVMR